MTGTPAINSAYRPKLYFHKYTDSHDTRP